MGAVAETGFVSSVIVNPITGRPERHSALLVMLYDLLASERTIKAAILGGHIQPETAKELTTLVAKAIQEPLVFGPEQSEKDVAKIMLSVFLSTRAMRQVVAGHFVVTKACGRVQRTKQVAELKMLCEDVVGGMRVH
jgi:hypothetical protein